MASGWKGWRSGRRAAKYPWSGRTICPRGPMRLHPARVCRPYAAGDSRIRALATLGMPARRFLHDPPRFQGPLLLVAGSADHVLPPEHIERFLALYPNASAQILAGADHFYRGHTVAAGAAVA